MSSLDGDWLLVILCVSSCCCDLQVVEPSAAFFGCLPVAVRVKMRACSGVRTVPYIPRKGAQNKITLDHSTISQIPLVAE